jgi:hypothetical protein
MRQSLTNRLRKVEKRLASRANSESEPQTVLWLPDNKRDTRYLVPTLAQCKSTRQELDPLPSEKRYDGLREV